MILMEGQTTPEAPPTQEPPPTPPPAAPAPVAPPPPSPSSSTSSNGSGTIFTKLVINDLIRMGYTYAMFLFVALIMVKFQTLEYQHVFIMTFLYVILTLAAEFVWLYLFRQGYRSEKAKDIGARDTFHDLLNNILPFTILIFGYSTLLDGFRSGHFASDGEHIEFYVRTISGILFIIAYSYLFIELFNRLNTNRSSLDTKAPYVGWKTDYKDEDKKDVSLFDNIIDLLYNLFQPISILVIAGLMYVFIRFTTSGNTVAGAAAPTI
jgi:hypothetical protein